VLPGVAVENVEGNRVLLITSSRRTGITYPDRGGAYQCFDQVAVTRPMAKWAESAQSFERIPELLRTALRHCWSGRPGVVHLDVPENLINGPGPEPRLPEAGSYRASHPLEASDDEVERAAKMLSTARLPMIHAGSGVVHAQAHDELRRVAEQLHAPVTTSWAARGVLDEHSPLAWPMIHVQACTQLRNAADVVLCVGSDIGETDWWGKPPYWGKQGDQRWIQVDVDDAVLGRNRPVQLAIRSDARSFLARLHEALQDLPAHDDERETRVAELAADKQSDREQLDAVLQQRQSPMVTAHVGASARQTFADDAVFVFDGGNSAVWGHAYTELRLPNTQLSTAHMGHLGAGVGQALGAAVAFPERQVCCIIGDGAMAFQMQEVETAIRHGLRPVFLVCVDRQWGMVKLTQKLSLAPVADQFQHALGTDGQGSINTDLGEIGWDRVAESMGGHGERVADPDELPAAIERSLASGRCAVIHVDVDPMMHLAAPGLSHFKDMHQEPSGE
jgi:acetolactate synthase-1/2/3 large subunit